MKVKSGKLRGDKVKYKDGIGCCVWYPLDGDENSGICFDFSFSDIDDFITLLGKLKKRKVTIYKRKGDK